MAVTFGFMDETAERIGIYSQRVTEVFARKVAHWHPAITTLVHPCTAPTASDKET